ncbi:MAG TPA: mannose-1-phosphate guanylyltransferase/mannose-6-phosphate isomerase [Methylobacterium sp.]|jgi:mannose-1-phosphate guanylyltransferase/mannose-1-phosphate guanylyltransferase/mannose-6-phosphate isomerase|nr:mannose-1-phosphate guanylyltransferase/mannose-6-phosphate isomerase [Methylobacterium sp.]
MSIGGVTPVILSGGAGTRLWPLSVPDRPKQLLALTGDLTMLQMTALRAAEPPIVVAGQGHADEVERQLAQVGVALRSLVLEPAGRNTAPAIALAALLAPPDAPLLVMPSDHLIADLESFEEAVEAALAVAADGWLVTFGITPERPETGYGYIERGERVGERVHRAVSFREKPDAATAAAYLADGKHLWNGGIFLFRRDVFLEALEAHAPEVLAAAEAAVAGRRDEGRRIYPDGTAFAASPAISIDYAVMEKAERIAVAPVAMGWSDLGSWDALYEAAAKDGDGNVVGGEALAVGSGGCLIRSDGPVVTAVGVHDLVIVATKDAVLVLPRGETQRVREAVEALKAR